MIRDSRTLAAFLMGLVLPLLDARGREGWVFVVLVVAVPWDRLARSVGPLLAEGWHRFELHRWEKKQARLIVEGR